MTKVPDLARSVLAQADWLNAQRLRRIAAVFAVTVALLVAGDAWLHTRLGVTDVQGNPLARDFINYWSGARLAAEGHAAQVYEPKAFVAFERAHTAANAPWRWYSYPPVSLLLSLPLGPTGFVSGLILWIAAGYGLCALLLSRTVGWGWGLVGAIATPAALMNVLSGQNGAFAAAMLAGGLLVLQSRPWLAGALLGALCFKPHLGLLIPLALAVGGYGRVFLAASLSVLALCGASVLLFGSGVWIAFLHNASFNVVVLETGAGFWPRMPTAFAAVRLLGGSVTLAWWAQGLCALAAALVVVRVWRSAASTPVKGAALIFATFLTTPYAWDYDLIAVTFAVAWMVNEARVTGFAPFEKIALALAVALPLLIMPFLAAHLQPGFLLLWPALIVTARRALAGGRSRAAGFMPLGKIAEARP